MKKIFRLCCFILASSLLFSGCSFKGEKTGTEADGIYETDNIYNDLGEDTLWLSVWEFDTFNPIATASSSVADCAFLVFDALFVPKKDMEMKPVLAKEYTTSEDGLKYTIKLNCAFKFHDGSDFGAKDVLYTINQIKNLGRSCVYYENVSNIESVLALDDETVEINTHLPQALFINNLCFPIVKDKTSMTTKVEEPVGTGPYKFKSSNLAKAMYFEANKDYPLGEVKIKNAVVKFLPERKLQTYALQAKQVDAACFSTDELGNYNPKGGVSTIYYNNRQLTFIGINSNKDFLQYKAVRKSISKIIDRADIVNSVLFGKGEEAVLPFPKDSYFYPEKYKDTSKNLTEAASLLDSAGFVPGESNIRVKTKDDKTKIKASLSILVNLENDERIMTANKIKDSLLQAGIDAKIIKTDFETYKKMISAGEYDMYIGEVKMNLAHITNFLVGTYANYSIFSEKELDDCILKTRTAKGKEETISAYAELSDCLAENMPIVCLYFGRDAMVLNSKLNCGGFVVSGCEFSNLSDWEKE